VFGGGVLPGMILMVGVSRLGRDYIIAQRQVKKKYSIGEW
jgi:hypothetical protein